MDSPPTSDIAFVTLDGAPLDEPLEWTACYVQVAVAEASWQETRLTRNSSPLPLLVRELGGEFRVLAEWPRSSTGSYLLCLEQPEVPTVSRTVTVRPSKISDDAYRQMLMDLKNGLPASIAVALQRGGALSGVRILAPEKQTLNQQLVRLRSALFDRPGRPGLLAVLAGLAQDPHAMLTSQEVWVRRERARRIHPTRLAQAVSQSGNLAADGLPIRLPEVRVEHTVDVYENRLVRTFADQARLRIARLLASVSDKDAAHPELIELAASLRGARRKAEFLNEVGELTRAPDLVTMVLLKKPFYRAALEGFLEFRKTSIVELDETRLDAPLENVPFLYQTWGTLQVIDVVLEEALDDGFVVRREALASPHSSGLFIRLLRDNRAALILTHPDGRTLRVTPQRTYSKSGGLRSFTLRQVPDVAIEFSDGDVTRVSIFDPKYKLTSEELGTSGEAGEGSAQPTGKPVKIDINAMHAYRDAVRDSAGHRVVGYAAILYPGPRRTYSEGLEALTADPSDPKRLRRAVRTAMRRMLKPQDGGGSARAGTF